MSNFDIRRLQGLNLSRYSRSIRTSLHLEVATFEGQTFITRTFKKTSFVSHGFQTGLSNFGGIRRFMYIVFTSTPSTIEKQHILIFELQNFFIL